MAMMTVVASYVILMSFCVTGGKAEECQPPTGVMAEAVGADRVHVTWELPPDFVCRIGFRVSFTPERGGDRLSTGVGTSEYEYTVLGLHCNTAYIFTVGTVAQNGLTVTWSEGVRALAGGPRNFSAAVVSYTSVHLTWEPPESPCNESITGYEAIYTCSECGMSGEGSSPALTGVEYTFVNLEEDTEYQFRLRAAGKDFTDPVSVRTPTAGTGVVMGNTATSSESLGAGKITTTLLATAVTAASRTLPVYPAAGHTTGEHLPTPTPMNGSPTSVTGSGSSSPVGVAVGLAVVVVLLVMIKVTIMHGCAMLMHVLFSITICQHAVSPEQQCNSCWPVAGGVIAGTVVVETVIVTVLTTVIWYLWRSISKMKQLHKSSPGMAMVECPAYGEVKPQPNGPPPEAIYEQPQ